MLGYFPCVAFSNRLVCRIADDADADHPRHSHQQDSLFPEPGKLGADRHNFIHHGLWDVAALFPRGLGAGLHASPANVLANPDAHAARLYGPDANYQSLAAEEAVDITRHLSATEP